MAVIRATADRGAVIDRNYPNTTHVAAETVNGLKKCLSKFAIPDTLIGKAISDVTLFMRSVDNGGAWDYSADIIESAWSESTVTYNSKPTIFKQSLYFSPGGLASAKLSDNGLVGIDVIKAIIDNGIMYSGSSNGSPETLVYTHASANAPYLDIAYVDPTIYIDDISPQSGYASKTLPTTLSWRTAAENYVYGGVTQTSAVVEWRDGSSGSVNSINVGTAQQCTIPGGTFASDTIQWRVTVVASGQTKTSAWHTMSTVEDTSTATLVSPVSGFVDSTKPATFAWQHVISTGTTQTAFDLQTSSDGMAYSTIASGQTANEFVEIPANTIAPGQLYWRVRTYNSDGAPGEWSDPARVIAIGAPDTPIVTVDSTGPRPSIRWQSSGQQGYEISIDGAVVLQTFGVARSYSVNDYLSDGQHTLSVRVQSQYGLWSDLGSASVQVSNTPGAAIKLTATGGKLAMLSWSTSGQYDKYYIYRDGELIGKTTSGQYADYLANGIHVYQIRGAYDSSDNYTMSNSAQAEIKPESVIISAVDGSVSIDLPLSESNKRSTTMSTTRQMATMYFSGSPLPSVEVSEWVDRSMTITAALRAGESKRDLMELVGKLVCVKDQYGNCVIGPLSGWSIRDFEMYSTAQTTVQDVNWREEIKHDPIS